MIIRNSIVHASRIPDGSIREKTSNSNKMREIVFSILKSLEPLLRES